MKKLIYTIGILMFLSGPLHPWTGLAADETAPTKEAASDTCPGFFSRFAKTLYDESPDLGDKGLDWGATFGDKDPKKVGQNLYCLIYKKTQTKPLDEAINATASQYGIPAERMALILGGDLSPILERSPLMRVEEAINIYNQMAATYADKKNSSQLNATVKAKVEPNEMFADGDLSNSGFDLINDLNNIEIILFKKNDPVTYGMGYKPSKSSGGSDESTNTSTLPNGSTADIPIDLYGGSAGGAGTTTTTPKPDPCLENPFKVKPEDKSAILTGGINPNQCFSSSNLDNALDKFSKDAKKNGKLNSTACPKPEDKKPTDPVTGDGGVSDSGGSDINVDIPIVEGSDKADELQPAPPGNFDSPALCDDIVCITLDFIKKPATPTFNKTDNCIDCHIQYINESLQKTISHNLIPAKASGNLMESGLCKNAAAVALGSIGMNVTKNWVPPITPVKNDLLNLSNPAEEWDKYAADNGLWNYGEKQRRLAEAAKGKPTDYSPIMSDLERMLVVEIVNAEDGKPLGAITDKAAASYGTLKANEQKELLVAEISKDAYDQVNTLQALGDEMRTMNKFFEGFKKQMRTLLEDVPGLNSTKACVKLKEKKVCS